MNLKAKGMDHVNIEVISLKESVDFHKKLFGFDVLKEQPDQNSKIIGNEGVKLCLYEIPEFKGYTKKGFHIENFDDRMQKCTEMDIEIFYCGPLKWESSTSIYNKDPNGYVIELSEDFGGGL